MIGKILQSRTARKFLRNRLALAASVIIGIYFLVAVFFFFGPITLDDTDVRVGPKHIRGLFMNAKPERRLEQLESYLHEVETALASPNPEEGLADIKVGKLQVANKSLPELQAIVDDCRRMYNNIAKSSDLDDGPRTLPELERLEKKKSELFKPLDKYDSTVQMFYVSLGTDRQGRSIALRAIFSIKVAFQIGAVTSIISVLVGSFLGAAAAFFGGWVDHLVIWLYSTFSSVPNLVLLVVLAYAFSGTVFDGTLVPVYVSFCMTFWIGPCRVIRGETLKLKELEFVHAARAMGFNRIYILLRHVIPNTAHLMLVNFSLLFIGAIKSEVILSFLGLGVKKGPSWGIMISQAKSEVITGYFWQIGTATVFMVGLVLAFNILTDA
ncbi:MAG: peptide/nickel transport system permease protein, partial [Pirellulaceae bacterium]